MATRRAGRLARSSPVPMRGVEPGSERLVECSQRPLPYGLSTMGRLFASVPLPDRRRRGRSREPDLRAVAHEAARAAPARCGRGLPRPRGIGGKGGSSVGAAANTFGRMSPVAAALRRVRVPRRLFEPLHAKPDSSPATRHQAFIAVCGGGEFPAGAGRALPRRMEAAYPIHRIFTALSTTGRPRQVQRTAGGRLRFMAAVIQASEQGTRACSFSSFVPPTRGGAARDSEVPRGNWSASSGRTWTAATRPPHRWIGSPPGSANCSPPAVWRARCS